MRRHAQGLHDEEITKILEKNTSGVLALSGDEGYPYAVPMSYVYTDGKFYFHSASTGHKIDAILRDEKASFCVIDQDEVIPEKYTTYFRSVIAFGKMRILETNDEKRAALEKLAKKYRPDHEKDLSHAIGTEFSNVCVMELSPEHITGKEAIELVKKKKSLSD
jgi:nitroimidazol reductase NimA-like FMN-containing flavoprotein (pyridoxamine 5'-phosphate oxidase superfamily)